MNEHFNLVNIKFQLADLNIWILTVQWPIELVDLLVQMLNARCHHNQNVPREGEDAGGAQWELPSCLAKNITNSFYMWRY